MPCYASTVVKIKYVKKHGKESADFMRIWAISCYPVEREDYEIEMILFVPANMYERDLETQAVFEKDNFYCVGGKIVPNNYGKDKKVKVFYRIFD